MHTGSTDWLRDVILGGQGGLVSILGIVLGVISGGGDRTVLLAAGFAAAITESISMGAVGFTSTTADRDFFNAQRAVEKAAVDDDTDLERREVTELYRSKGFSGPLLDQVVATITANRDKWVETILEDERHLRGRCANPDILRSSVTITLATLIGHLIPLLPVRASWRAPTALGPGRDPECGGALRGRDVPGAHQGRLLVEAGSAHGVHRPRRRRARIRDRSYLPRRGGLTPHVVAKGRGGHRSDASSGSVDPH